MNRPRRRDRLREDLFDRTEDFLHHVIAWLPLAGSVVVAVGLHWLVWSRWLPDSDEAWVLLLRGALLIAEGTAVGTMVGPTAIEAFWNLVHVFLVGYRKARAIGRGRDPAQLELEEPNSERER